MLVTPDHRIAPGRHAARAGGRLGIRPDQLALQQRSGRRRARARARPGRGEPRRRRAAPRAVAECLQPGNELHPSDLAVRPLRHGSPQAGDVDVGGVGGEDELRPQLLGGHDPLGDAVGGGHRPDLVGDLLERATAHDAEPAVDELGQRGRGRPCTAGPRRRQLRSDRRRGTRNQAVPAGRARRSSGRTSDAVWRPGCAATRWHGSAARSATAGRRAPRRRPPGHGRSPTPAGVDLQGRAPAPVARRQLRPAPGRARPARCPPLRGRPPHVVRPWAETMAPRGRTRETGAGTTASGRPAAAPRDPVGCQSSSRPGCRSIGTGRTRCRRRDAVATARTPVVSVRPATSRMSATSDPVDGSGFPGRRESTSRRWGSRSRAPTPR